MKTIRIFSTVAVAVTVSAFLGACNKEYDPNSGGLSDDSLGFKICSVENPETRAAAEEWLQPVDLSEKGFPLLVTPSVSVNTAAPVDDERTRGAMVTKESLLESCETSGIPMYMLTTNGSATDVKEGKLKKNDDSYPEEYWSLFGSDGKKIDWVESGTMSGATASFLSYYDKAGTDVVTAVNYNTLTFTYEGIESNFSLGTSAPEDANDASNMEDFIVAYTASIDHQTDHGTGEQVNTVLLHYYHPLAAVRFVAPVASDRDQSVSINRVTINNVKTGGSVTYNTATDITSATAFKTAFNWSLGDNRGNYAQKFSTDKNEMTFFIVPQSLADVVVTFNIVHTSGSTKHEHQLTAPASKLGTNSWDQGYVYTYTLDTKALGKVDIDIQEDFTAGSTTKSNVTIANLVQSTAFVRAKAIANWCTNNGKVIAYCPLDDSMINTTNWLKGADGYYYCNLPVRGYSESPVFITQYTQPSVADSGIANANQIIGLHVEMSIIAQAVESDVYSPSGTTYIEAAWADFDGNILLADGRNLLDLLKF
ncbi:MAG: hypothetical protein MJY84_05715 [Bacteroidales bacterium]|nr:hypothetical protein [Bacteroidales bacterium]